MSPGKAKDEVAALLSEVEIGPYKIKPWSFGRFKKVYPALIGIVPVGHMGEREDRDWKGLIAGAREAIFKRIKLMGVHDLQDHIKFETCFTPLSWHKRYNLVNGSTHGLCHNLMQLGYFRPGSRHPRYPNVYFVGASTHPGTGMPTALISARHAAQRILEDSNRGAV